MSTCKRGGATYKRHSYKTKKVRTEVQQSLKACVHCEHPKPIKKEKV